MTMKHLIVLNWILVGTLLASSHSVSAERPNILLILADDLGIETLGCYGGTSYATPNLDQLAMDGLRFDHCYSMAVCHPTRVTLLTGRYPFRWGHPSWGSYPKEAEAVSLGRRMTELGYSTAVAGKWQLTLLKEDLDHPHRLGFEEYCLFGWHEGARYFDPLIYQNGDLRNDVRDRYGPDVYTDFLIDFMRRHRDGPFCAFYSMALCHDVTDDLKKPVPYGPKGRYENYQEMVESMDRCVGRLMQALKQLDLEDNTVVLFTGDNGTPQRMILTAEDENYQRVPVQSQWRGMTVPGGKGKLTNDGTHVPLIVRWPNRIAKRARTEALVDMSDFLPTLMDLAGKPVSSTPIDGVSFKAVLEDPAQSARTWIFAEHNKKSWVRNQQRKLYHDGRFVKVDDFEEEKAIDVTQLDANERDDFDQLMRAQKSLKHKQLE
jgi:arylsulfatase A